MKNDYTPECQVAEEEIPLKKNVFQKSEKPINL